MKITPLLLLPSVALLGAAAPVPTDPPAAPQAASPAEGQVLFEQRCQSCHSVEPGRSSPLGPSLAGVVGRKAAAAEFRYSAALKASNLTWTRENLDAYLAAPAKLVPGTRMVVGVAGPAQRAAVLAYLAGTSATTAAPGEHGAHAGH